MRLSLELADGEVATVVAQDHKVLVRLAAAHVSRLADGARSGQTEAGFARGVELLLIGASLGDAPGPFIGRIVDGSLHCDGRRSVRLPLPSEAKGAIRIELTFAHQTHLVLSATSLHCRFAGEANFTPSLAC